MEQEKKTPILVHVTYSAVSKNGDYLILSLKDNDGNPFKLIVPTQLNPKSKNYRYKAVAEGGKWSLNGTYAVEQKPKQTESKPEEGELPF